ncbi:hypothetical protein LZ30DRAFT_740985 [Colletotrichum cereale]|nr:hypothetical protein LZ30DRAFT_740985 [Colletotrichum cereale]
MLKMLAPPRSDPEVFEEEKNRVGRNWGACYAEHPDLRGIPGLAFPGSPDEPVAHGGRDAFGLFFDGVTVPSHETKLRVAHNARNWFQLLYIWVGRLDATMPIDQHFLIILGTTTRDATTSIRGSVAPRTCSSFWPASWRPGRKLLAVPWILPASRGFTTLLTGALGIHRTAG